MKKAFSKALALFTVTAILFSALCIFPANAEGEEWDTEFIITKNETDLTRLDTDFTAYTFDDVRTNDMATNTYLPSVAYTATRGTVGKGYLLPCPDYHPKNTGIAYSALTYTAKPYRDFYAEYDYFFGYTISGIAFGADKGKMPFSRDKVETNDTGAIIFMERNWGGIVNIGGAINKSSFDYSTGYEHSAPVPQSNLSDTLNVRQYNLALDGNVNFQTGATNEVIDDAIPYYTICVSVVGNLLKIWMKDYPEHYFTIELTNYTGGYVSLVNSGANYQGAIRGFRIKEGSNTTVDIPKAYQFDRGFTNSNISSLDTAFTSYRFGANDMSAVASESATADWTSSSTSVKDSNDNTILPIYGFFANNYIKPLINNATGSGTALLTVKNKVVSDFEAKLEYCINQTGYGIMVAPEGEKSNFENGGLSVYVGGSGQIRVSGAVDGINAVCSGGLANQTETSCETAKNNDYVVCVGDWDHATSNKTVYTLCIEVADGSLTAYLKEFPQNVLTVPLLPNYMGGSVSMFSTGGNHGGIREFGLTEIGTPDAQNVSLSLERERINENYIAVSLYTNKAVKLDTVLNFDTNYTFEKALLPSNVLKLNPTAKFTAVNNNIRIFINSPAEGKLVTFIFINSDNSNAGFELSGDTYISGNVKNTTEFSSSLGGDANDDGIVDLTDIIRYKKYLAGTSQDINMGAVDLIHTNDITNVQNLALLKKRIMGISSLEISELFGKSALYLGDSIAYGANDILGGLSYGGRIASIYGMTSTVAARSGWTLAEHSDKNPIVDQLNDVDASEYNYIILQGGVNDIWHSTNVTAADDPDCVIPLGTLTEEGDYDFDVTTQIGALENLIVNAQLSNSDAKIGYIINFDISDRIGDMSQFVNAAIQVCEKYGIPYLNLYGDQQFNAQFDKSVYLMADGVHPNSNGYDFLADYIAEWMMTL